jgi:hypothetical protein
VVVSGLLFAALSLFSYQLFGWTIDGWVLALGGAVHLAVVLRTYPRLDGFLIAFHYFVALVGFAGIGWVLVDVTGPAAGAGGVLLALLQDQWSEPVQYAILAGYVLLLSALFLSLVVVFSWLFRRRKPWRQELLAGLFVASLLNIPCDFALADALSQVAVLDPEESQAFVFAVGVESLDLPLLLHGLIALLVVAVSGWYGWKLQHRLSGEIAHPSRSP